MTEEFLEKKVTELEARVAALEARLALYEKVSSPEPSSPSQLAYHLETLLKEAPKRLLRTVRPTCEEAIALAQDDDPAARERLSTVLIPELVELCENARRTEDTGELFYETLPARLEAVMEECELEPIRPSRGAPYQTVLHNAVRVVRCQESELRDTVELCLSPGFRWRGSLLKKAEVTIFL